MSIAQYCKQKGFTLEQYENFSNNIESIAQAIYSTITYKGGMYYPITDILPYNTNEDLKPFIIAELKQLGVEFIENYTLYRI